MTALRSLLAFAIALALLSGCVWYESGVSGGGDGVEARRRLDTAIATATPASTTAGIANRTWIQSLGSSGQAVHYSTSDERDFLWMPESSRIIVGQWRVDTGPDVHGKPITRLCLRYPGEARGPLGAVVAGEWYCPPAGMMLDRMTDSRAGDLLGLATRTQAPFARGYERATIAQLLARLPRS